eukprot:TRINITY_DN15167_c0_g1_i1.p1 TRINITY_DN15167_c0_g1~~TRINITY_DN15167_c0_g1_i1.p1  ORF type:complete len:611 (+),score=196.58 TRINITY_DN15167_c0_g1_i1:241-2073(+)
MSVDHQKIIDDLRFQLGLFIKDSCRSECEPCQKARVKCSKMLPLLQKLERPPASQSSELDQLRAEVEHLRSSRDPSRAENEVDRLREALARAQRKLDGAVKAGTPDPPVERSPGAMPGNHEVALLRQQLQESHTKLAELGAELVAVRATSKLAAEQHSAAALSEQEFKQLRGENQALRASLSQSVREREAMEERHKSLSQALSSEVFSALGPGASNHASSAGAAELLKAQAQQIRNWGSGNNAHMSAALEATILELVEQFERSQKASAANAAQLSEELDQCTRASAQMANEMETLKRAGQESIHQLTSQLQEKEVELSVICNRLELSASSGLAERAAYERDLHAKYEMDVRELADQNDECLESLRMVQQEQQEVGTVLQGMFALPDQQVWSSLLQLATHVKAGVTDKLASLTDRTTRAEHDADSLRAQAGSMAEALRNMGQLNLRLEAELESMLAELTRQVVASPSGGDVGFLDPLEKQCRTVRKQLDKLKGELEAQILAHQECSRGPETIPMKVSELLSSQGTGRDELIGAIEQIVTPESQNFSVRNAAERIVKLLREKDGVFSENRHDSIVKTELLLVIAMVESLIKHIQQEKIKHSKSSVDSPALSS